MKKNEIIEFLQGGQGRVAITMMFDISEGETNTHMMMDGVMREFFTQHPELWDDFLRSVVREHVDSMIRRGFNGHDGVEGRAYGKDGKEVRIPVDADGVPLLPDEDIKELLGLTD